MPDPIVSIITRTRDRAVLLRRAAESVLGQENPPPLEWIVVNDGGDPAPVEAVLETARLRLGDQLKVLHLKTSRGMEHASNHGIAHASGEFLTIHDDDDSWDPGFLREMSDCLLRPEHAKHAGAVCQSIRVEESLDSERVRILRESPFNPWLTELTTWRILEQNPFPPISFLFRRSAYDEIGPFDESLPVLGDWEFNLRIILRWPLAVLPKPLARYHHRISGTAGAMANSITAGHDRHQEWDRVLRDRWQENPPLKELSHFGELARIAGASKSVRDHTHQLLSLPIRPGPQV